MSDETDLWGRGLRELQRGLAWIGRRERGTIVSLLVVCGGVWGFVELTNEVSAGTTNSFDRQILLALRSPQDLSDPIGPRWLEEMMRDFTALGGVGLIATLTGAALGVLLLEGKSRGLGLLIAAVVGGFILSNTLKWIVDRPRPNLVPKESYVYTSSFPSGHSMLAASTYLTIGALLARMHAGAATKAYFIILATLLTVAVGISRVYLGVHWPTDVLAGWTIGGCWALICWIVAGGLQNSGRLEPDTTVEQTSPELHSPEPPPTTANRISTSATLSMLPISTATLVIVDAMSHSNDARI
ncbi:MAG: phosphatase PAP2 family protein [Planctomycetaceae bacterium]